MTLSPFTTVLRIYVEKGESAQDDSLRTLLRSVAEDDHLVEYNDEIPSIDILCECLRKSRDHGSLHEVYLFFDHCFSQCSRKSVIYHEARVALIEHLLEEPSGVTGNNIDLLMIVIADQWRFVVKTATPSAILNITKLLVDYLNASMQAGRDTGLLAAIRHRIREDTEDKECRALLEGALNLSFKSAHVGKCGHIHEATGPAIKGGARSESDPEGQSVSESESFADSENYLDYESEAKSESDPPDENFDKGPASRDNILLQGPPEEDDDHRVLNQWSRETIPEVVLEGTLGELILCLCSKYMDIRRQALKGLRTLRDGMKVSRRASAFSRKC